MHTKQLLSRSIQHKHFLCVAGKTSGGLLQPYMVETDKLKKPALLLAQDPSNGSCTRAAVPLWGLISTGCMHGGLLIILQFWIDGKFLMDHLVNLSDCF